MALAAVKSSSGLLRHGVCHVVQTPIEHLDQERVLLQYPAVDVVGETWRFGCFDWDSEHAVV